MNESMSITVFSENQVRLADEHYQRGNLKGAIEIVNSLTFGYPNSSANHRKISQVLIAYQIHSRLLQDLTYYGILGISNPFCSHQMIQSKYKDLVVKLCPNRNKSIAAKSAFAIINTAWKILSDPERRRDYNVEEGFERMIIFPEFEPNQSAGKCHCIEIIDDFDYDSDSD